MASPISFDTVLALAQQLAPADQARLAAALTAAAPQQADATADYPALAPKVRQVLAGMTIDDMVVPPSGTPEDALALLQSWADEAGVGTEGDSESWDDMLRSLDANRFSTRELFPDLHQR